MKRTLRQNLQVVLAVGAMSVSSLIAVGSVSAAPLTPLTPLDNCGHSFSTSGYVGGSATMTLSGGACSPTSVYVDCAGVGGTTSPGGTYTNGPISSGSISVSCAGTSQRTHYGYQDYSGKHQAG